MVARSLPRVGPSERSIVTRSLKCRFREKITADIGKRSWLKWERMDMGAVKIGHKFLDKTDIARLAHPQFTATCRPSVRGPNRVATDGRFGP